MFVSSTFLDNQVRRKLVMDAILRAGMMPVGMERFTASTRPAVEECVAQVRGCDWLVGILAYRYGWIPPGQPEGQERSITEMEYDAAKAEGMPRLMFVLDGSVDVNPQRDFDEGAERWKKQELLERFKRKIGADLLPAWFREDDLGVQVFQALAEERMRQAERRLQEQAARTSSPGDASAATTGVGEQASAMGSSDEGEPADIVDELARVFHESGLAEVLVTRAGVPQGRRPAFTRPLVFWTRVVDEARSGLLAGGIGPIVAEAAKMFPSNPVFRRYREEGEQGAGRRGAR
ncbi:MAG: DUF4062 domain-containing protein [Myxococcales bacterium]|nr:DUF4062 domain-containing protein [Myxococcales bacterium]